MCPYQPTASLTLELQPAVPVMSAAAACSLHVLCRDSLRNGVSRAAQTFGVHINTAPGMFHAWIWWLAYRWLCQGWIIVISSSSHWFLSPGISPVSASFTFYLALWHYHCGKCCRGHPNIQSFPFLTTSVFLPASVCSAKIDNSYIYQLLISNWQM